jgi:hypothetical protein
VQRRTFVLSLACALVAGSATAAAVAPHMSFLDNGVIRVGVNLDEGGTITYLSKSSDTNSVINDHDLGRQVQQSYYAGPDSFGGASWPWNPIGAGDGYGHPSQVVSLTNDGATLYVRIVPMQWALSSVPGECFFESWITLDGNAVRVRYRLTNHRSDLTQYGAFGQELPAVYSIGTLYRLVTYDGDAPFTGAATRELTTVGPPWLTYTPTENWMALVNDAGFGLGVLNTDSYTFIAGFAGPPNVGGPSDDSTGYIAPLRDEIIDHNITYDHDVALILGTTSDIRAYAVAHRRKETRPDYHFAIDHFQENRQHFTYVNASDAGLPLKGGLTVRLDQNDPQIWMPESRWDAATMPILYVNAGRSRVRASMVRAASASPSFPTASSTPTRSTSRPRRPTRERSRG